MSIVLYSQDSITVNKYQLAELIIENNTNKSIIIQHIKSLDLKRKQLKDAVKDVAELKELSKKETLKAIARGNRLANKVKFQNIIIITEAVAIIGLSITIAVVK